MRFLPRLTTLEDRCTPATTTWAPVGISEDGSAGANWTNGVPGNGDTAVIPDNSNDCNLTGISPLLAKLDVQCDGIGGRQGVSLDTLRVGEIDAAHTNFYIGTKLEARGFGQSNLDSCNMQVSDPGFGEFLVSGTAETFVDECHFDNPVTVTGTLVLSGEDNTVDHYNWSVSGTLDFNAAALANPNNPATITVSGLITSSAPISGSVMSGTGCKVVITSTGTMRLNGDPSNVSGLIVGSQVESGFSLVSAGTIELYGGNRLYAIPQGIQVTDGAIKIYPKETQTAWHGASIHGDATLDACDVTFMSGTSGQQGRAALDWYGDVDMTGDVVVDMTKNWTTGAYNHWVIDGDLTLTGGNTFAMTNVALPTNPPTGTGQILFINATDIVNDFSTYTIDGRFLSDVFDTGPDEAIRIRWTLQSWPGNE